MILWYTAILIFILKIETKGNELRGPVFSIEPPWRITFLNINKTEIRCSADGVPYPKIIWKTREGDAARYVPGLRHTRSDGTLVFLPFNSTDYNKEIHDSFYYCTATNLLGSIVSRKVHVRGVIKQTFNLEVQSVYVRRGDTAVLKCPVPTFAENYVSVESWIRNDDCTLRMTDANSCYTVLSSGELLIYEIEDTDSEWGYRCQTRNKLSGDMIISTTEGKVYVTDSNSTTVPEIMFHKDYVLAEKGSAVQLPCVANGNPSPTYRRMKFENGAWQPVKEDSRVWLVQGTLNIRKVYDSDVGRYLCIAQNSIGETLIQSMLFVRAPKSVHLSPSLHFLSIGQDATFTCNISGYPLHSVSWKKDTVPIVPSNRVQLLSRDVLHISSLQGEDMGMYQCFAHNAIGGAQGTAELIVLVGVQWTLEQKNATVALGNSLWIDCATVELPAPSFLGVKLTYTESENRELYISIHADSNATLVTSDKEEENAGGFFCQLNNGFDKGLRNIIYFQVLVPPRFKYYNQEIVTIEGHNVTLKCHVIGDAPITISWQKSKTIFETKSDPRYVSRIISKKNETISELHIYHTTKSDTGKYTCVAVSKLGRDKTIIELQVRELDEYGRYETSPPKTNKTLVVPPRFKWPDDDIWTREGRNTTLECHAIGDMPITITWQKNQTIVRAKSNPRYTFRIISKKNETISELHIFNTTKSDAGNYTCVAVSDIGRARKNVELTVTLPPSFLWPYDEVLVTVEGGNATLICYVIADHPIRLFSWRKNKSIVEVKSNPRYFIQIHTTKNSTISELQIIHTTRSDEADYSCHVASRAGLIIKSIYLEVISSYGP